MAEALSIIGLTSGITVFINFVSSLIFKAKLARDAWNGTVPETNELRLMIEDLTQTQNSLVSLGEFLEGGNCDWLDLAMHARPVRYK